MTAPPDSIMQTGAGLFDEIGGMLDDGLIIASAGGEIQSANNAAIRFLGEGLVGHFAESHGEIKWPKFVRRKFTVCVGLGAFGLHEVFESIVAK